MVVSVVRQQDLMQDMPRGWVHEQLAAAAVADIKLVVVEGAPPLPIQTSRGTYVFLDFQHFVDAQFNNTRNALRLLGPPSTCTEEGDIWTATWTQRLEKLDGTLIPVKVKINNAGNDVEWKYGEIVPPAKRDPKL